MKLRRPVILFAMLSVVVLSIGMPTPALAIGPNAILAGFNSSGYGGNDDGSFPCTSSGAGTPIGCTPTLVSLPFSFNFFGNTYSALYLNNNGNLTFDSALSTFTPFTLLGTTHVIIAPFFADVDTRLGNTVTFGSGTVNGRPAWGANWPGVGCFSEITSVLNYFQVILIDRSDIGLGDFDIMFNYDQVTWDTGQASNGNSVCLDAINSARAGYSNGSTSSFELPGSGISGALLDSNSATGLIHNTLNCAGQLGCYVFGVRNGTPQVSDLSVTKTGPSSAVPGQSVTYQITATNNGPSDATGVLVTDMLPAGATVTSATPSQGSCTGTGPVICAIGNLANGSSASITIVATLNTSGANVDTASVTGDQPDPTPANNSASVSTDVAQPTKASPTIATSATDVVVGGTISDTATLTGGNAPTGAVTFNLFGPNNPGCTLPAAFTSTTPVIGNGSTSGSFTPLATGTYLWVATYSGDGSNNPANTVCGASGETSTVTQASPTIATSATATATVGGTISDTATLTGGNAPTGTITFNAFGPNNPGCTMPAAFTSTTAVSGNSSTSAPFAPLLPGTYLWVATYNGNTNNNSASTLCGDPGETSTVTKASPTITTSATPTATVGGTISDTATLTGGNAPTGTITFNAFGPNNPGCTLPAAFTSTMPLSGSGSTSAPFAPLLPGTYLWVATYSGDGNNFSANTVCGASGETSTVTKASPTITTSATATATVGGTISDTATLTGGNAPTGTITFKLFGPNNPGCTLPAAFTSTMPLSGSGSTSAPFTPLLPGTYLWVATYSGNGNNNSASTACGATGETSVVTLLFAPGGGSFVIGDNNAVVGNSVTFWGAQWSKLNSLSGGPAPASFKGFAESPNAPSCIAANWSADTGSSTPPPPGPLPAFMGVIVTSKAGQSGSTDSGNIVEIVVVQTNPGYQPDAGHVGTGKVVAIIVC